MYGDIIADLESLRSNLQIHNAKNFIQRSQALDKLEFLLAHFAEPDDEHRRDAEILKSSLEEIDRSLFQDLRDQLKNSQCKGQLLQNFLKQ
jgi:hypothetical protein